MNQYVYHRKPKDFKGNLLYPLNALKDIYPDAYKHQIAKYQGRMELMQQRIPLLDCLWNDVIHLAPVNPEKVYHNIRLAGGSTNKKTWFRWNISDLVEKKWLIYEGPNSKSPKLEKRHFSYLSAKKYSELADLPEATKLYYKKAIEEGSPTLMFICCPHILLKDVLDINLGEEIEVE